MSFASGDRSLEDAARMDTTEDETSTTGDADAQPSIPEVDGGSRASSSSGSDSSVAVNCQSFPTEVVVHGQKVKKVRVLFTPFPPRKSASFGNEQSLSYSSRRRLTTSTSSESLTLRSRHSRVAQATDDVGHEVLSVPLSQEESSGHYTDSAQQSVVDTTQTALAGSEEDRANGEGRIRIEIENGIAFITEKMKGLLQMNKRLRIELENEKRKSLEMNDLLATSETRWQAVERENSELKLQLDSKEKESMRFAGQAKEEWQTRIRLEETLVELKRDKDSEVGDLKATLDAKNLEIKELEGELKNRKQANEKENKTREETVEMLAQIRILEETIRSLQKENAKVTEFARSLEADVESWKLKYDNSRHDLDIHMARFEMLKNDYTHLQAENQRLAKAQTRILREPQHAWSASVIDLPEQPRSSPNGPAQSQVLANRFNLTGSGGRISGHKQLAQIRRRSHDSEHGSSCSLPPVPKTNK